MHVFVRVNLLLSISLIFFFVTSESVPVFAVYVWSNKNVWHYRNAMCTSWLLLHSEIVIRRRRQQIFTFLCFYSIFQTEQKKNDMKTTIACKPGHGDPSNRKKNAFFPLASSLVCVWLTSFRLCWFFFSQRFVRCFECVLDVQITKRKTIMKSLAGDIVSHSILTYFSSTLIHLLDAFPSPSLPVHFDFSLLISSYILFTYSLHRFLCLLPSFGKIS